LAAYCQPPAQPAFEVAAIKPSKIEPGHSSWNTHPGNLVMRNQTLKACLKIAYRVRDYQFSGGPPWLDSDRFDIEAKARGPANDDELLAMLRTLLAERFQLALHHESKIGPAYALVVAKKGLKIRPVGGGSGSRTNSGRGRIDGQHMSMAKLAETLSHMLDRPVLDMTGNHEYFDLKLEWTPDSATLMAKPEAEPAAAASGPSLFTALQEQLGLRLEARKAPIDILVIDRAEKPSEN
jgi:uncharacterized protein (TIGR03435 family)